MRAGPHLTLGALAGFAAARVWLSGLELGEFMGGFTGSSVDLTPHVRHRGKNLLALRLTNEHNPDAPGVSGERLPADVSTCYCRTIGPSGPMAHRTDQGPFWPLGLTT